MAGAALLAEPRSPHTHTCRRRRRRRKGAVHIHARQPGRGRPRRRGQSRPARTKPFREDGGDGAAARWGSAGWRPGAPNPEPGRARAPAGGDARGAGGGACGWAGPERGDKGAGLRAAWEPRSAGAARPGPAPLRVPRWPPRRRSSEPGRLGAEGRGGQARIAELRITFPIGFLGLAFRGSPASIPVVRVLPLAPTPTPSN